MNYIYDNTVELCLNPQPEDRTEEVEQPKWRPANTATFFDHKCRSFPTFRSGGIEWKIENIQSRKDSSASYHTVSQYREALSCRWRKCNALKWRVFHIRCFRVGTCKHQHQKMMGRDGSRWWWVEMVVVATTSALGELTTAWKTATRNKRKMHMQNRVVCQSVTDAILHALLEPENKFVVT